ncbi:hypothetical protein JW710_01775 [Candidatus Dojkabacteria bacterium]|nr:hypothetical protein [Candidatus Dojkabacteria bacterium]
MKFKKIVITGMTEPELSDEYWNRIYEVAESKVFLSADSPELKEHLKDTDALFVKFNPVDRDMMGAAPNLKYIGVFATGYGKIDIEYAKEKGITVCNVPGYSTESVAELVFAVILEYIRDLERAKVQAREGNYSEDGFSATEIKDKNFGVVGLGRIGQRVAKIAAGFGANVKYWSRNQKDIENKSVEYSEVDDLLASCDFISLHLALNDETENFLNADRIEKIKDGAVIVNTAPMELVDLEALIGRLEKGDITFILDHSDEMEEEDLKRLSKYENCIIYPPIGYISDEAGEAKREIFVSNLESYASGNPTNVAS